MFYLSKRLNFTILGGVAMNKKLAKIIVALVVINVWVAYVVIAQPLSKEKSADFLAVPTSTNISIAKSQNQFKFPEDNPTTRVYENQELYLKPIKGEELW